MAVYRNISVTFWTDSKIDDDFTPEDKYIFLYLLTNPHTNICGCYELSIKQMIKETGYNSEKIKQELQRLEKVHKVILYDNKTKEVLIINWSKYNWSKSSKVEKAVLRVGDGIKSGKFKKIIFALNNNSILNKDIYKTVTDTVTVTGTGTVTAVSVDTDTDTAVYTDTDTDTVVSIGYTYPMHTLSETAKEAEINTNKFTPPTIEEINAYCKERNSSIEPESFYDYYESNGWKVGKNPMKDWKATLRRWERTQFDNKSNNNGSSEPELTKGEDGFYYDKNGDRYI